MNGAGGQAAGSPVTQGNGQPSSGGGSAIPAGYTLVPEAEWGQAQRWKQQVEGSRQEFERYKSKYEPWTGAIETFSKSGIDPKSFAAQQAQSGQTQGAAFDPKAIESAIEDRFKAFEQRMSKAEAFRSHTATLESQKKALDKLVSDVVGDKADEKTKAAVRSMAIGMYNESLQSNFYPEGHPLHQEAFAPLPEEKFGQLGSSLGDLYKSLRGSQLGAIADAAARGNKSAPAGQSNSGGAADNTKPRDPTEALARNIEDSLARRRQMK